LRLNLGKMHCYWVLCESQALTHSSDNYPTITLFVGRFTDESPMPYRWRSGQGSYKMPFTGDFQASCWSNNACNILTMKDLETRLAQQLSYHS
jgi:hypothetical protein